MTRAVFARPVRICGADFAAGRECEIPPAVLSHWYFAALKKDGLAKIVEDAPAAKETPAKAEEKTAAPPVKAVTEKPAPAPAKAVKAPVKAPPKKQPAPKTAGRK